MCWAPSWKRKPDFQSDRLLRRIAKPPGMQDFKPEDVFYMGGPNSTHLAYLFESRRAIWHVLVCSTYKMAAGETSKSFRKPGWKKIAMRMR